MRITTKGIFRPDIVGENHTDGSCSLQVHTACKSFSYFGQPNKNLATDSMQRIPGKVTAGMPGTSFNADYVKVQ